MTYIIWTWTTVGYILFGHKLFNIHYLDIDHCWKYLIMLNMNHEPQLDMDYFGLIPLLDIWHLINYNIGHHLTHITIMFNLSFNQSYSIKHIIYLFQPLSRFLDFGLYLFCRLKNAPEAIGLCSPMLSSGLNSPKQI